MVTSVSHLDPLALELNAALEGTAAGALLSALGRRLFFPRGIIAQAAEAKKTARINATLGMAFKGGKPLVLSPVARHFSCLGPDETVIYAPTAGVDAFRRGWKGQILRKNPSLREGDFSLPAAAPGITAGISYMADLFLDEGQVMLAPDPCWDNYGLIFAERRGGRLRGVPLFNRGPVSADGTLNIAAFERAVREEAASGAVRMILNFPHNPSGYTLCESEAAALVQIAADAACRVPVLVLCDDAYFGLFYEESCLGESLFSRFAPLHKNLLAVKIDGPTKEDYVWGFRTAFVSFGSLGLGGEAAAALEKKLMGAIRSSVSCTNTPAQHLALKIMDDPAAAEEKKTFFALLRERYRTVKRFIEENPPPPPLEALPFNSGYFMCFRCGGQAEKIRQGLLAKGIGAVAMGTEYLRVTFAAIESEDIPAVYRAIYETSVK